MTLAQIANRAPPVAWQDDYKIPWHEPGFSQRMLQEHLDQAHNRASRPLPVIARQVSFIESQLLQGNQSRILDLGCGPGFYCRLLTERGHQCTGVDFSPASIEYARSQDGRSNYVLQDLRDYDPGNGYDLVMMTFGEFNAFSQPDALNLIHKMRDAAWPSGIVLLEVHGEQAIRNIGTAPPAWVSLPRSVFCEGPHLYLTEHFWDEPNLTAISRYYVLDDSGQMNQYINTLQGYRQHDYISL